MDYMLPHRKKNRLEEYDYSSPGAYFITFCTKAKECLLWESADNDEHLLSSAGKISEKYILKIHEYYSNVEIINYTVMPNHIHLLLQITDENVGADIIRPQKAHKSVSTIIGQLKRIISKEVGFDIWQKSFHDHIVRNESEYKKIWEYIEYNPQMWEKDCFYDKNDSAQAGG